MILSGIEIKQENNDEQHPSNINLINICFKSVSYKAYSACVTFMAACLQSPLGIFILL